MGEFEAVLSEFLKNEKFARGDVDALVAAADAGQLRRVERFVEIAMRCDSNAAQTVANACVVALRRRFGSGDSVRVARLEGMLLEAQGDFERALNLYAAVAQSIAPRAPPVAIVGRQASVLRHVKQFAQCVALLNSYLAVAPADALAWRALLGVHLELHQFAFARHCVEQLLVLVSPQNDPALAILYADLLATLGETPLAKQYYVVAVDLLPRSPRALYGLLFCLQQTPKRTAADDTLLRYVKQTLARLYAGAGSPLAKFVEQQ